MLFFLSWKVTMHISICHTVPHKWQDVLGIQTAKFFQNWAVYAVLYSILGASHQHQVLPWRDGGIRFWRVGWTCVFSKRFFFQRRGLCLHLRQLLAWEDKAMHHLRLERDLRVFHRGEVLLPPSPRFSLNIEMPEQIQVYLMLGLFSQFGFFFWYAFLSFLVKVECSEKDLHSGVFGGSIYEAMPDLIALMGN